MRGQRKRADMLEAKTVEEMACHLYGYESFAEIEGLDSSQELYEMLEMFGLCSRCSLSVALKLVFLIGQHVRVPTPTAR